MSIRGDEGPIRQRSMGNATKQWCMRTVWEPVDNKWVRPSCSTQSLAHAHNDAFTRHRRQPRHKSQHAEHNYSDYGENKNKWLCLLINHLVHVSYTVSTLLLRTSQFKAQGVIQHFKKIKDNVWCPVYPRLHDVSMTFAVVCNNWIRI